MKSDKGPVINLSSLPFDYSLILLFLIVYCTCWSRGNILDYSYLHWTEKPGRLQSMGLQSWTWLSAHTRTPPPTHTHNGSLHWNPAASLDQEKGRNRGAVAGGQLGLWWVLSQLCLWLGGREGQLEAENFWLSKWRWFAAIRQWHIVREFNSFSA